MTINKWGYMKKIILSSLVIAGNLSGMEHQENKTVQDFIHSLAKKTPWHHVSKSSEENQYIAAFLNFDKELQSNGAEVFFKDKKNKYFLDLSTRIFKDIDEDDEQKRLFVKAKQATLQVNEVPTGQSFDNALQLTNDAWKAWKSKVTTILQPRLQIEHNKILLMNEIKGFFNHESKISDVDAYHKSAEMMAKVMPLTIAIFLQKQREEMRKIVVNVNVIEFFDDEEYQSLFKK